MNTPKNGIIAVIAFCFVNVLHAQQDMAPPFKRFPTVPPILLLQTDSSVFAKKDLKKNRPTILMYFDPTCDHCRQQIEDMIKGMDRLKQFQIILASFESMEKLIAFQKTYQLKKYSNIQLGRDTKYTLAPFYKIRSLPYLALYDKKGNLITTFEGNVKIEKLLEAFD